MLVLAGENLELAARVFLQSIAKKEKPNQINITHALSNANLPSDSFSVERILNHIQSTRPNFPREAFASLFLS